MNKLTFCSRPLGRLPRALLTLCAVWLILSVPARAQEDDDAPGFRQCMNQALSTVDINECHRLSFQYWDELMQQNYETSLQACDTLSEQGAQAPARCKNALREAQRAWLKYREAMAAYLNSANDGTIRELIVGAFMAEATREQSRRLQNPD